MIMKPAYGTVSSVIGLALLFASPIPASADTALTVGKSNATSDAIIPVNVGDELGIFKKHGLSLKIIDFGGGSKMAQALAAGSIDIGDGAGTEMAFVAKGAPMIAVCESTAPAPFLGIGVPWDSPIKTLDDLKGKKIGVSSPNSMTYWMALELARHYGWKKDEFTIVTIGGSTAAVVAGLRAHLIDADIGGTATAFQLEEQKVGRFLIPVSDYLGNMSSDTIFASKALIASNPDAIRRFLAGWFEAVDFMRGNKAETVRIARKMTGFDETVQAREYDQAIPMFSNDGKFDKESLATLKRSFADLKLLDFEPDLATTYTEAYLPKR
jgi:NitT/TauT family transport system substrate-binding protein